MSGKRKQPETKRELRLRRLSTVLGPAAWMMTRSNYNADKARELFLEAQGSGEVAPWRALLQPPDNDAGSARAKRIDAENLRELQLQYATEGHQTNVRSVTGQYLQWCDETGRWPHQVDSCESVALWLTRKIIIIIIIIPQRSR